MNEIYRCRKFARKSPATIPFATPDTFFVPVYLFLLEHSLHYLCCFPSVDGNADLVADPPIESVGVVVTIYECIEWIFLGEIHVIISIYFANSQFPLIRSRIQ